MKGLVASTLLLVSTFASEPPSWLRKPASRSTLAYSNHPFEAVNLLPENARRTSEYYASLRITATYDSAASFSDKGKVVANRMSTANLDLITRLMNRAISFWQGSLAIVRLTSPLSFPPDCVSKWTNKNAGKCAELDAQPKCGYSSVPASHLSAASVCKTCYTDGTCECESSPSGGGVVDTDLLIYVTAAEDEEACSAGSQTLAYAYSCQRDQYDRPVAGTVNFCPNKLDPDPANFEVQVLTAVHEVAHILGFSADSWQYFRKQDGLPYNTRDAFGEPVVTNSFTCPTTNGGIQDVAVPAVLDISTERGGLVHKIKTPTVLQVVRDYFDCATLAGVELENQPTTSGACFGSHLENRLFADDAMVAVDVDDGTGQLPFKSQLMLAILHDSGWYRAEFSATGVSTPRFGRGAGCAFTTDKCVSSSGSALHPFCADSADGCSADYTHTALCAKETYLRYSACNNNLVQYKKITLESCGSACAKSQKSASS